MGNKLYVGEAAGLQDLWGFGIRSSIISGFLAAKAIINDENLLNLLEDILRKNSSQVW
jgi:flavin-dependent dehydrogenase